MNPKANVKARVEQLPDAVFDCERCDSKDSMQIRRSSLNEQFKADDIGLKCSECYYYATHGVAFGSLEQFTSERKARNGRVLDFTRDNEGNPTEENLAALGYIAASKEVD